MVDRGSNQSIPQIYDCHNPQRLQFEMFLRQYYPDPDKVFFAIERQVWSIGTACLNDFAEKFWPQRYKEFGCTSTHGGIIFHGIDVLPCCPEPGPNDYFLLVRLWVYEGTAVWVPDYDLY